MEQCDRHAEIAALRALVCPGPGLRPGLAPALAERLTPERLAALVEATRARVGGVTEVDDGPEGLQVHGRSGHVLAWVHLDAAGAIDALMLSPRLRRGVGTWRGRVPRALPDVTLCVLLGLVAVVLWTASGVWQWASAACNLAIIVIVLAGIAPWGALRAPLHWTAGLLVVAALAAVVRLPGLPRSGDPRLFALWAVVTAAVLVGVVRARRHRWGVAVTTPLRFPLRGTWYVMHGGGRLLNHHARVPQQRAAVDLVKAGRWGTRVPGGAPRDTAAYLAWDAEVCAPCDGRVVSAVGDLEDQVPGRPRYGPPFGNHVFIDTGAETVRLGHLRAGSVLVRPGDSVRAGQPIGRVGNSGHSSEPHLHVQADQDGLGLDLVFTDVPGRLFRGARVRAL